MKPGKVRQSILPSDWPIGEADRETAAEHSEDIISNTLLSLLHRSELTSTIRQDVNARRDEKKT